MREIIRLENVVKMMDDGRRAVNGVSLSVSKGDCMAVHGASGSGKTTLMRLIAGMERPSSGKVFVLDQALHEMDADAAAGFRNRYMGILNRNPAFMDGLTVLDNVALPLSIRGISLAQREKTAKEQLKTLGLQYAANARPSQLSALELQKASIARALTAHPQILLLDDTAAGLSEKDAEQIKGILRALSKFGEYTVIEFSETNSGLICSDSTLILTHGKIREEIEQ
jgi:ABC-type lipoprotein export system ATPase subunit